MMLTVAEASRLLGVAEGTLRFWLVRKKVAYFKIGGAVRVPESEVARLLRDGLVPARPPRAQKAKTMEAST